MQPIPLKPRKEKKKKKREGRILAHAWFLVASKTNNTAPVLFIFSTVESRGPILRQFYEI